MPMLSASPTRQRQRPGQRTVPPFGERWVPDGYTGPVALPGTGRMVYWTGRIAIGLRWSQSSATNESNPAFQM